MTLDSFDLILAFHGGKPVRVRPHLRHGGSSVAGACVAPHGIHQRVGGKGVVGGSGAHVLLKAFDDRPVGPGDQRDG